MQKNNLSSRFAVWYVPFAYKHRKSILLLAVLLLGLALWPVATQLKIKADLSSLLPENTPSVLALKESYGRFGSTDRFMIAIQSEDPELVAQLQTEIKAELEANWKDELVNAQIDNDNQFFKDKALLYLPVDHLERIRNNLEEIQNELGRDNLPMVVDLLSEEEPANADTTVEPKKKEERVWFDASIPQELGLPDEAADAFSEFFIKDSAEIAANNGPTWDPKANLPTHLRTRLIGQQKDSKQFNGIVQCKLTMPSTDMDFVGVILTKSDKLIAKFSGRDYAVPVKITVEGTYEGLREVEDLQSDSTISFALSLLMIIGLVVWFFKSWKAPIILIGQVLFACILMLGFTAVWYGHLNPFTVFVASIILGMGIDYSIHMMATCQRFYTETHDLHKSLVLTLEHLLNPLFLAALTTVAGLLTLLIAQFRGFYEFGVIASMGLVFSVVTAILGLPVMIFAAGGLPKVVRTSYFPMAWSESQIAKFVQRTAIVMLGISVLLAALTPFAEFEHNLQNLRRPAREAEHDAKINTGVAITSTRKSSSPAAVMGDSPAQIDKLYDTLMVRLHKEKDPMLRSFLTLRTFVPSQTDQEERLEMIEEIRDLIYARVFDRATGQDSSSIHTLRKLVNLEEPFTAEDIPAWALDLLRERDGSYGKIAFIYGNYPSWDARAVAAFQDKYGHWNFEGKDLRVFSSQFILSDVIRAVKQDSTRMAVFIFVVIVLTMVFSLRNGKMILIGTIALLLGLVWTVGFMGLFTLLFDLGKVGIYNVIVIPTILGVGIDSTIHLMVAWMQEKDKGLRHLWDTTGRSVIASSLTTVAGFAGVLFTAHRGLRTIGELSTIGIIVFLATSMIFTSWLCKLWLDKPTQNS